MNGSKKILVVDDSKLVLSLHVSILKKMGFACTSAENGAVALENCTKGPFDLIVTDINMPKMDGYEFIKKVRLTSGCEQIPIIVISTEQEAQDKSKGIEAGANVYVVKPVEADELVMHVKMLLGA